VKRFIAINQIKISDNRQRREFKEDELRQLSESIQTHGLFHAITLRIEGDHYVLVSGERRLRAITDLYELGGKFNYDGESVIPDSIPYVTLGELDAIAREEAELEENIRRVDLSWSEAAAATSRLADLRKRIAARDNLPTPTTADLTVEVKGNLTGGGHEATRRQLIVAEHLHDPEVKAAKTLDDAWKVLKKKEDIKRNETLAAEVGRTFTADVHKLYNEDSCEWLKRCSAERFDVILTDPPYGMGADKFGDSGGMAEGAHGYTDSREYFVKLMQTFCYHSFRVAKSQAHAYVFCDIDNFFDLRLWMTEAGWDVFRTPLIWHKPTAIRAPWPFSGPYRRYETILFAKKGDRPVNKLYPDVLSYPSDDNRGHHAQKPVALFDDLLRRSVRPGDVVLDPFCGSGPIFPACHNLKCAAVGIELDSSAYAISIKRIEELRQQPELAGL